MLTKVTLELDAMALAVIQQSLNLASLNIQATQSTVQEQIRQQLEKGEAKVPKPPLRTVEK